MNPLDAWQERLAVRFDDVTLRKLDLPQEPVTFALEHGLSSDERDELSEAVRANAAQQILRTRHYLAWVTYAAEVGYGYAGDEYWYTFEELTPCWSLRSRRFIKSCFVKFATQYNGAVPRGPWARHRSIICWPITHAILPTDLQRQLAEILYRMRHSLAMDDVETPRQLGQMIAGRSYEASARFRRLASEHDLIGQIAAELLLEDQPRNLIEPATLSRIAEDLKIEQQSRSWLQDTKRQLSRRAQLRGLRRRPVVDEERKASEAPPPQAPLRPLLSLRRIGDRDWRLVIDVPDLTPLVRDYPAVEPIFSDGVFLVGRDERPYPARGLLHGSQMVAPTAWPTPGQPLLAFEPSRPELDALVRHRCTFEDGPWLFRVGADGIARQIRSKRLSQRADYVVVWQARDAPPQTPGDLVNLHCEAVTARHIAATSTTDLADVLSEFGFQLARKIVVTPAGIVPAAWDGEGSGEWLSSDQPIIALSANYDVAHYDMRTDIGGAIFDLTVKPDTPQDTVLVRLPRLEPGVYQLRIATHPLKSTERAEDGELELRIRDPAPDSERARSRLAMLAMPEPVDATFDAVFNETLQVQVLGPASRGVDVTLRLFGRDEVVPLFTAELPKFSLPVSRDEWAKRIRHLIHNEGAFSAAYSVADACELTFDGDELGIHRLRYERPFTPLRWVVTPAAKGPSLRLIDDVEHPERIDIQHYRFSTPETGRAITQGERQRAATGPARPGLYVARSDGFIASTIVAMQTLDELRQVQPRFRRRPRSWDSVNAFLDAIDAWGNVDTTGNVFGRYAWRRALSALVQQVSGLIGGTPWYKADLRFARDGKLAPLANRIPYKHHGTVWPRRLLDALDELRGADIRHRVDVFSKLTDQPSDVGRFALQLASDPTNIRQQYAVQFEALCSQIMHRSETLRAARFVVLATSNSNAALTDTERALYPGWSWA